MKTPAALLSGVVVSEEVDHDVDAGPDDRCSGAS
jgi:hypothetical protein